MFLFDRKLQLITASGLNFKSWEGVKIYFKYTTMDGEGVPTAEIEIKNLTRELREKIIEEKAIFSIGYGDMVSDLINGDIKNIENGNTVIFDIIGNSSHFNECNSWYGKGVRENFIVQDIASKANIKLQGADLLKEYIRPNGYTVTGSAIDSITHIAQNRELGVTFDGEILKIYPLQGYKTEILLTPTSGLLNVTKYKKNDVNGENGENGSYDYIIHAIPIPSLKQGSIFRVEHDYFKGNVKCVDFEINGKANWNAKYYCEVV